MKSDLRRTMVMVCLGVGLVVIGVMLSSCQATGSGQTTTGDRERRSDSSAALTYGHLPERQASPAPSARARGLARASADAPASWEWIGPKPPGEELWVIERWEEDEPRKRQPSSFMDMTMEDVGAGALLVSPFEDAEPEFVHAPLQHTSVEADIAGWLATVGVTQHFANPFGAKIEAVYVFPLPQDAAVSGFIMTVGERKIRAIVREREEAQRIYEEARSEGYRAALLTQERPNVFTQRVANIEPGEAIDIDITYYHAVPQRDGAFEFTFPMVVGPRYNPSGTTEGVAAVGRGDRGISGQATEVTYLTPDERTGHTIELSVRLNTGVGITHIASPTHRVDIDRPLGKPGRAEVRLAKRDVIPNKDFVLRYELDQRETSAAFVAHEEGDVGYFALTLRAPERVERLPRMPLELIFVLDTSGSMEGEPLKQAKDAVREALRRLRPEDAFQIIRFSDSASSFGREPVYATDHNIREALRQLDRLEAGGGTEMLAGVRTALGFPTGPDRLRFVCFLTDGLLGNERQVLAEISGNLGDSRVFSFGIGSSPNRYLLERLAVLGRGAAAFLSAGDSGAEVMSRFLYRVTRPALADITLDFGSIPVIEAAPLVVPDLYVGRPVTIMGTYDARAFAGGVIQVEGRAGTSVVRLDVPADVNDAGRHPALVDMWGRAKIADLLNEHLRDPGFDPTDRVRQTALRFGVLSPYTAMLAVDTAERTEGDHGYEIRQPVPVPQGVRYETTVSGGER